jgi:hypothetical protein
MTMGPVMRACTDGALDDIMNLQIVGGNKRRQRRASESLSKRQNTDEIKA